MIDSSSLRVSPLTEDALAPYGWFLGKPMTGSSATIYTDPATDFWHQCMFDPGAGGRAEILWVNYRNNDPIVAKLEKHHLTEQAVVPLEGEIIQVLALSAPDGAPDLATLRAFRLQPGVGISMRPGVWHATRSAASTCLMLTRSSTTVDLIRHLTAAAPPVESMMRDIPPVRLLMSETETG
jgi:ureidoglycolate lyase